MATLPTEIKQDEKPKWITLEEAEKFEKLIGRQFIPKDDAEFAKKFFYKVESVIPYSPANSDGGPDNSLYHFLVQKYRRDKVEKVTIATDGGSTEEMEVNQRVESHQMHNGNWICVDDKANMLIDSHRFKKQFKPDDVE